MSDKNQGKAMLTEEEKISFGEKLKSTRESMGMSVQDAAGRLHLSPRFINLLENENLLHTSLPLIYLRGYLRSYARLLHIPENELAQILEKLDPRPLALDPLPVASSALPLTFPLENSPYYARLGTFFIALALLTSMTTWWYLHANNNTSSTIIALKQPLTPEQETTTPHNETPAMALNNMGKETPLNFNTNLETAATNPAAEPTQVPDASINLTTKKPVTLASAAPEQNMHNLAPKPAQGREENDDDSAADEQE